MSQTVTVTDQLNRTVHIPFPPMRIVSLVPSQTELLFDLGLQERIVGLTRFCIYPQEKVKDKAKVGGTKQFYYEKIKALNPCLIIGNKEENYAEGIQELEKHFPVWMSDVYSLDDALVMISEVGRITGTSEKAAQLLSQIQFPVVELKQQYTAAYFIWRKPYMVAAADTFIHEMMKKLGVVNVFANAARYPEVNPLHLAEIKPDFIFLSSEPYSFRDIHIEEFCDFSPLSKVVLVNGEMFSWYGSRLQHVPAYFQKLRSQLKMA